jgi:hypothetical protein
VPEYLMELMKDVTIIVGHIRAWVNEKLLPNIFGAKTWICDSNDDSDGDYFQIFAL